MESNDGAILCESNLFQEIRLKMNLPDHRIKLWWKWRYLVPVESIHSPMLTLNVFNQRHHDNRKTYNTASATLISNVMIKKSVSMQYKRRCFSLIPAESNSLPHARAQTTKTYYKHQDLRIKKAQEFKTKTSANSDIQDLPLRYQAYQGRLLASFQDDAKYEHVGQDTRPQDSKDDKDKQGKDSKISESKMKSKDNDKG
ncbi:hypothetical protein Tco_1057126 [Tanacetum coccineum]|uniref:Uncharacterized protein n=1 Tax=Tanacetum coccineum TaxID=301880 RepID=A0ABQ5H5W0_9ASTR